MNPEKEPNKPLDQIVSAVPMEESIITAAPQLNDITPVPTPKKRVSILGVIIVVIFLFLLLGGGGVSAALIAYDKITLPNSDIQAAVREVVMSLSFTPKTATYVIEKTALAASAVTGATIDASVAVNGSSLIPLSGTSNIDISVKGTFDKTDANNVKSQFSIKAGSLLSADLKATDKKVYLKINTFPTKLVTPFIPLSEDMITSELSHWIVWDTGALDTEARALIEKNNQSEDTQIQNLANVLKNKTLMSKIALTTEDLEGSSVYKLHPTVDAEFVKAYIAEFGTEQQKQSVDTSKWMDSLNNFNVDIYIDKQSYLVHRVNVSFSTKQDSTLLSPVESMVPGMSSGDVQVAVVLKLSNYNVPLTVSVPVDTKGWQDVFSDFTSALVSTQSAVLINPQNQFAAARDAQRKADLLSITNAVYLYASDNNGKLPTTETAVFPTKPTCIGTSKACFDLSHAGTAGNTLVPAYISNMPKDPKNGTDADTKYSIYIDANGRLQSQATGEKDPTTPITVVR